MISGSARHITPAPKERVLELWSRLVQGDVDGFLRSQGKLVIKRLKP